MPALRSLAQTKACYSIFWLNDKDNSTHDYIGMWFRGTDDGNFAWVSLESNEKVWIKLFKAGQQVDGHGFAFNWQVGKLYHIQVEMEDSKLSVFLDGGAIGEVDWEGNPILPEKGEIGCWRGRSPL